MRTELNSRAFVTDLRYLSLLDLSVYNTDIPVTNAIYRIELPNFSKYVDVSYTPGSLVNINSNLLRLTNTTKVDGLVNIPAGLYRITQSICPNDKLYHEFNFFNIEPDLMKLAELICESETKSGADFERLFILKGRLETSKIMAESCCLEDEAIKLYNTTVKEIQKLKSDCC